MSDQGPSMPGTVPAEAAAGGGTSPSVTMSSGRPGGSPASGSAHDWTVDVADRIESVVGAVRDKTTVPVTKIVRGIVFGLVAATLGVVALIFGLIGLFRLIEVYLPIEPYSARVWGTYAVFGAIFLVLGAFCWAKRKGRSKD